MDETEDAVDQFNIGVVDVAHSSRSSMISF